MAERMVSFHVDVDRFRLRLTDFLARTEREAERVVFETAAQVLSDIQVGWPVDTGFSRASWWGPRKVGTLAYQVGNPVSYASTIEYGGYRGVGPLTHRLPGERLTGGFVVNPGIYSRRVPSAPVRRALAKNYGRLTNEIKRIHQQNWGR